ncbi:MAG TPA: cytochrome P450, partial [Ktedonobacteraceae bacterium]|nr:cytochrome P450 [Ktedonobacteraceae bacterium]
NAANFTKSADYRALARVLGRGLLTSEGDFWQRQRGLIQPAFHKQNIQAYAAVMTGAAERMLNSWNDGGERNLHEDMMRVTLEIVAQCLYGAEVSSEAERVGRAMEVVTEGFVTSASLALLFSFDIPLFFARAERRAVRHLNEIIGGIIQERRTSNRRREDLLDMLLRARDADGKPMSDVQLRDEVMTLILAGHETTALALSWTWYLLAQHPEAEAELLAELQTALGGRAPTVADLPRLQYTEAVVKESMRLYPPAWATSRRAVHDSEIGGYSIPAGAELLLCQWVVQRDPRYYDDPEAFMPCRWQDEAIKRLPKYAYFPFGGGPRLCIGNSFAMMEAVLLLASMAQKFHCALVPGHPVIPWPSITLRPKHGIKMVVSRR